MDDLDVRIVKELGSPSSLQWNVRETYSGIARRLGVDEETVRRRLKRVQELGSITGWKTMVNPHLLGCRAACLDFEVENEGEKDKVLSQVCRSDGVVKVLDFRGKGLQATLYYEDDETLKRETELLTSSSKTIVWKIRFPRVNIRMTKTDWKIIGAILEDARTDLEEVSKSTGVSARTVERHLTAMTEARTIFLQGTPNFKNVVGLSCLFLVFCPEGGDIKRRVDELILTRVKRIEIANTTGEHYSTFAMLFDNLSQADDFTGWIKGIEGVEKVKMGILSDLIVPQDWIQKKVKELAA